MTFFLAKVNFCTAGTNSMKIEIVVISRGGMVAESIDRLTFKGNHTKFVRGQFS